MTLIRNLIYLVALSMLSLGTAHAQPAEKVTLMLNWFVYGEHAPFFLGKERGLFLAEGIDLDIQEGRGSAVTVQAVGAKSVDFAYADVGVMMRAVVRGAPVKSVGILLQSTPNAVISPADRNITTPTDLVGRTIAITPGDALTPLWPLYLNKTGLKEGQYKTVAGDAQTKMNAVTTRQADALLGSITEQGARMPGIIGQPVNILRFADAGIELIGLGIIVHNDTMRSKPDLVKRMMRAATRSAEAAINEPDAAISAMLKAKPQAGQPEAQLASLKLAQSLYYTADSKGNRPYRASRKAIDNSLEILVQYGGIPEAQRGKVDDYYTMEYLP